MEKSITFFYSASTVKSPAFQLKNYKSPKKVKSEVNLKTEVRHGLRERAVQQICLKQPLAVQFYHQPFQQTILKHSKAILYSMILNNIDITFWNWK